MNIVTGMKTVMMSVPAEVEAVLHRIEACQGVLGSTVSNVEGQIIRNTMDSQLADKALPLLREFCEMTSNAVRDLDPSNELGYVRLGTRRGEIMVAPDAAYTIVVWQTLIKSN